MALFSLGFRELLNDGTIQELEALLGKQSGYLLEEHNDDGSHGDITADSITADTGTIPSMVGPVTITRQTTVNQLIVAKDGVLSPAQITANQNNWNPADASFPLRSLTDVRVLRVTSDAARDITGLTAPMTDISAVTGTPEQRQVELLFVNRGNFSITLKHSSSSSSAANRFLCPNSRDFIVPSGGSVWLWYDSGTANWRVVAAVTAPTSGTYTPTLTKVTNLSGTPHAYTCQWLRVGDTVTVSGKFGAEPTAAASTRTVLAMSLPVVSGISAAENVGGTAVAVTSTPTVEACQIEGDATNDRALISWAAAATSDHDFFFTFTYLVL